MRTLTNCELIQLLLEANQPHAKVEVEGHTTCDGVEHVEPGGYASVPIAMPVVGVRSALNKILLEVGE